MVHADYCELAAKVEDKVQKVKDVQYRICSGSLWALVKRLLYGPEDVHRIRGFILQAVVNGTKAGLTIGPAIN